MKKKILSLILTGAMLLGTAAIEPPHAEAEILNNDKYTFLDTCYSPELGIYVAVAKDISVKSNTPGQVYVSNDMELWTMAKSFDKGTHDANPETRQTVVWWESQQVFALQMNNTLYTSPDGYTWTAVTTEGATGSNSTITTNGDVLAISARATVKVFKNLDELSESFAIDTTAGNNTYGKAIAVTPTEPYTYAVTDQYKTWMIQGGNIMSATPNLSAHPTDMIWVDSLNGWITVNDTNVLRVLNSSSISYNNFSAMVLSDGSTNTDKFTGAGVNDKFIVMGTDTGKLYVAPNDKNSLTVNTQWEIAQPGIGDENTDKIRSITAVDNDSFLVAADKTLLRLEQTDEGWRYYDISNAGIYIENTRIEVPESGSIDIPLEPVNYDSKGEVSYDPIVTFECATALPAGVSYEPTGSVSGVLTVDSTVSGGHELVYNVATENGREKEITVTIVDADHIEIRGNDEMAIPWEGEAPEIYEYSTAVVGTDGNDMAREVSLEPAEVPEGTEYDSETHTFTISDQMQNGEIVLEAYAVNSPDDVEAARKTVFASLREPKRIELDQGEEAIYIPNSGTESFEYTVKFYDQIDKEMPSAKAIWSMEPVEIDGTDAVSIDPETGVLTVGSKAVLGTIKLTAVSDIKDDIKTELTVTLQYTDLRKALEDQAEFTLDTSAPLTDDLKLLNVRPFGSTIKWRSSDETIIQTDGVVNRPSREDKTVTFTETVTNGTATLERKFEFVVLKDDNIVNNGGLEKGTDEGWEPKEGAEIEVSEEDGNTVLKVSGGGVYVVLPMTNNSSYAFEGDIKASEGAAVKVVSDKAGTLLEFTANGEWQPFTATYDYRNQNDSFEDKVYIECSGAITIDNLTVYEITLELNEVMAAVNKASYSKNQADIDAAKALVNSFYDLPIKNELLKKLNSLTVSGGGAGTGSGSTGGSSGGGGGGGGTSSAGTAPSKVPNTQPVNEVTLPGNSSTEKTEDALDTFLLNFKDMKSHWAREEVEFLGGLDIITGDENGNFRPDDNITRAEFAALTARTIGLSETPYENSFFDVVEDDWFSGWVQTCRSNDLMNGYDGLFNPYRLITREEIAKTVVSAYNLKANKQLERGKSLYFNDIDQISSWAYDYIAEAADMGFVNGVTEELFVPKRQATRAEAAVMLKRVYDELNGTGETKETPETPAAGADKEEETEDSGEAETSAEQ